MSAASGGSQPSARRGQLVVISGPSGSGKTTIKRRLAQHPAIQVAVTVTTRPPRAGEVADQAYHFVDREAFLRMEQEGRFAETNDVFSNGHLYGSLKAELEQALGRAGTVYLMEVDVTGARNLKRAGYAGTYVFIAPPSMAVLERRLRARGTDDPAAIERRLARAQEEMRQAQADGSQVVVNETVEASVAQVLRLIGLDAAGGAAPRPAPATGRPTPSDTLGKQERS
jgi:guanylate kinase